MTKAVYPGSFDPITVGHLDVIKRGARIFDELVVCVANNSSKPSFFTVDERYAFVKRLTRGMRNVKVDRVEGLVIEYVKKAKADFILRGIRSLTDFEYEFQMALTNRAISGREIETIFIMTDEKHSFVSSRLVKEAGELGADLSLFIPKSILRDVQAKFERPTAKAKGLRINTTRERAK